MTDGDAAVKFDVMAAMCDVSRGIGNNGRLPWPPLKKDYDFYTSLTSTLKTATKKTIITIRGKDTWLDSGSHERNLPNTQHIVVSRTLDKQKETHPQLLAICRSFQEAIDLCQSPEIKPDLDSVWIMGGARIYEEALNHPLCNKLYITHVYKEFPADTFFPEIDMTMFKEIKHDAIDYVHAEDNDVKYEFKLYQRR